MFLHDLSLLGRQRELLYEHGLISFQPDHVCDVLSTANVKHVGGEDGINPFEPPCVDPCLDNALSLCGWELAVRA